MAQFDKPGTGAHSAGDEADSGHSQDRLRAAADDTRAGARAIQARRPGRSDFAAEFEAFVAHAEKSGLIRDFPEIARPADTSGQEHDVWFDAASQRVFKATKPNTFGLRPDAEGQHAAPGYYLERLALQNELFNDDIRLEGVRVTPEGRIQVVTSQPTVRGEAATDEEIAAFFERAGFARHEIGGAVGWYDQARDVLVTDAHGANVLKTASGELVPIDVNLTRPEDALRERLGAGRPPPSEPR